MPEPGGLSPSETLLVPQQHLPGEGGWHSWRHPGTAGNTPTWPAAPQHSWQHPGTSVDTTTWPAAPQHHWQQYPNTASSTMAQLAAPCSPPWHFCLPGWHPPLLTPLLHPPLLLDPFSRALACPPLFTHLCSFMFACAHLFRHPCF